MLVLWKYFLLLVNCNTTANIVITSPAVFYYPKLFLVH